MGKIFNIQKFCTDDGPGIRTTIFLKGCPLHCIWCHNPESQSYETELFYNDEKCINCGKCVELCPNNCQVFEKKKHQYRREKCMNCGACVNSTCKALSIVGYEISAEKAIKEALKDKLFYDNSGGGITVSGGEPFYQAEFCIELLKKAKENKLHICMETCGFATSEIVKESAKYVDIYLFDLKEMDSKKHKEYTGVDNKVIFENLKLLDELNKSIILRCPIIPGYNDNAVHLEGIIRLADSCKNIKSIEMKSYHTLGVGKYKNLGRDYLVNDSTAPLNKEEISMWIEFMKEKTKIPILIS